MATIPTGILLSSLETSVRRLIQEEDTTNTNFQSSEIWDYLNEAVRRVATKLEWQLGIFTSSLAQDQSTYSIPPHIISVIECALDGKSIPILDRTDLARIYPSWLTDPAGEPKVAYRADRDKLGVYPKPDVNNAGKQMRMQAVKLPDTMDLVGDIPDLHLALHDTLPFYAAFRCELKAGNNQRAADFLKIFQDGISVVASQIEKFNDAALGFYWEV